MTDVCTLQSSTDTFMNKHEFFSSRFYCFFLRFLQNVFSIKFNFFFKYIRSIDMENKFYENLLFTSKEAVKKIKLSFK